MSTTRRTITATTYIASITLANYLTAHYGFIPVGFGLTATAGTIAAGLTLGLRDITQDAWGRLGTITLILAGAALSAAVATPALALASGAAFLLSETADMAIYTPLRARAETGDAKWASAVAASNTIGALIDTILFLALAFGTAAITPTAVAGQLLGKTWATLAIIIPTTTARRALPIRTQ